MYQQGVSPILYFFYFSLLRLSLSLKHMLLYILTLLWVPYKGFSSMVSGFIRSLIFSIFVRAGRDTGTITCLLYALSQLFFCCIQKDEGKSTVWPLLS